MRPLVRHFVLALAVASGCEPAPTLSGDASAVDAGDAADARAVPTPDVVTVDDGGACAVEVRATPLRTPTWEVAGAILHAGPLGAPPDQRTAMAEATRLLAPNHRFYRVDGLFGPGTPHAGPYTHELTELAGRAGLSVTSCFSTADLMAPRGVTLVLLAAPRAGAPVGSTPDGPSMPILANSLFPINLDVDLVRGGAVLDGEFDSAFPGPRSVSPPYEVDGWSHLVWIFADNDAWAGGQAFTAGEYTWRGTLLDATRAGWRIEVPMHVR